MQLQQYVVDIKLERSCDTFTTRAAFLGRRQMTWLGIATGVEQMQAAQVWNLHTVRLLNSRRRTATGLNAN
jgi:hypothetical protein